MKSLFNDYRSGTSTQRVAILADVASLLGVSAAAVAAGLFSISRHVHVGNVVFATAQSILFIGGLALTAAAYWLVDGQIRSRFQTAKFPNRMLRIAAGCAFLALVLLAGFSFYEYLDSYRYISGGA